MRVNRLRQFGVKPKSEGLVIILTLDLERVTIAKCQSDISMCALRCEMSSDISTPHSYCERLS